MKIKFKKTLSLIICSTILVMCIPFTVSAKEAIPNVEYVEDEVVFEYTFSKAYSKTNESAETYLANLFSEIGIESVEKIDTYDGSSTDMSVSKTVYEPISYVAKISGDVLDICDELEKVSGVSFAEPNYIYTTDSFSMPGELNFSSGVYKDYQKWYMNDIMNIPAAWEKYQNAGDDVIIAVIDNGFNISASQFPVNLWDDGNGNHGWNTCNNNNDISPIFQSDGVTPLADSSHGSNVAGIIGMLSDSSGAVGASFNSELMLIKAARYVSDTSVTTMPNTAVVSAINYAKNNGADVINMSLGSSVYSSLIKNAVKNANAAGCTLIAAAGNGYYNVDLGGNYPYSSEEMLFYPAADPNVIGVMAIDKTDTTQLAMFSNYDSSGEYYDVAAPGVDIIGCSCLSGQYSSNSGTSQATPLVAACAAMYISTHPDATNADVYDAIRNSPTKTVTSNKTAVTDTTYYFKVLDALELLDYSKPVIPEISTTTITLDNTNNYIYGLDEGFTDINDYITVTAETGTVEFTPNTMGNGTGSTVEIFDIHGEVYKTYTVIVFGDLNGDSYADGQDSVIANCLIAGIENYSDAIQFAADVDFNNSVTTDDSVIIAAYAIGNDNVFQSR